MNETAIGLLQTDAGAERRVSFSRRLLIYGAVWLLAALAFQVFLQPEGLTETSLAPMQQRIRWPLYTPLMAMVGLSYAVSWPDSPREDVGLAAGAGLVLHGILALACARRSRFIAFTLAQTLLLTVAVIYFIRQTQLPGDG